MLHPSSAESSSSSSSSSCCCCCCCCCCRFKYSSIVVNYHVLLKQTAIAPHKLLTFVAPPTATSKLQLRMPMATTQKKQLWSCMGGSHAWIYSSIGWSFFLMNLDWNEGHCQSLPALLFDALRTLADIRTEDANWTKEVPSFIATGDSSPS